MDERLYINDQLMDMSESAGIVQTKQLNRLDDLSTRQANYTNKIQLPKTSKNKKILDFLGEPGSLSRKQYQVASARLVLDSMEMISNGTAVIEDTSDVYEIKIYDGISKIFNAVDGLSIRDLDWSDLNHTATPQLIVDSMDGSKDYIYTLTGTATNLQVSSTFQRNLSEYMLPNVYEHVIFDRIITQAGFTYQGDVFGTDEFKSVIVGAVTTDPNEPNLNIKKIGYILPDISQADFIREIIWRYGLTFKRDGFSRNYIFKQLKNTIVDKANSLDWSNKLHSIDGINHRLGKYAKRSYFRYAGQSDDTDSKDGKINVDIATLSATVDLVNSKYWANVILTDSTYIDQEIFKFKENTDEYEIKEVNPWIFRLFQDPNPNAETIITNRGFNPAVTTPIRHYARFLNLNWTNFVNENYKQISEIANNPNVYTANLNISSTDFYSLDLFKTVYLKQFGSYFYINKVGPFKNDHKLTQAELVQIPITAFVVGTDNDQNPNEPPTLQISIAPTSINVGQTSTISINAVDPDGSWDQWYILKNNQQWMSGQGTPPSSVNYTPSDNEVGNVTFEMTVIDANALSASDTTSATVSNTDNIQLDNNTGTFTGPPGVTVQVELNTTGFTYANGELRVNTQTDNSGTSLLLLQTCTGGSGNNCPVDQGPTASGSFVIPSNGTAYITGQQFPGTDGSQDENATFFTITYLGESESGSFSEPNPYPN